MSELEKTKLRINIMVRQNEEFVAAISRGETPTIGLAQALRIVRADRKTLRHYALDLQDAEDFRTRDEGGSLTLMEKKRGWPPATLILFQYTPYIEGEDFELAEEALEAMTCILLDNMFEGFEGQVGKQVGDAVLWRSTNPRVKDTSLTAEAVLELGSDIPANKPLIDSDGVKRFKHERPRRSLMGVLDPTGHYEGKGGFGPKEEEEDRDPKEEEEDRDPVDEEKVESWTEFCDGLLYGIEKVLKAHLKHEEADLIGRGGQSSRERNVSLEGSWMVGGLWEDSGGENWLKKKPVAEWECNDCREKLGFIDSKLRPGAGREVTLWERCPVCANIQEEKPARLTDVKYWIPKGRRKNKVRLESLPVPHQRHENLGFSPVKFDFYCRACDAWWHEKTSVRTPRPESGWCKHCSDKAGIDEQVYPAARPTTKKHKKVSRDEWMGENDEQVYGGFGLDPTGSFRKRSNLSSWQLLSREGPDDYKSRRPEAGDAIGPGGEVEVDHRGVERSRAERERIPTTKGPDGNREQPLPKIRSLIDKTGKRKDKRDNMWRVVQGLLMDANRMDLDPNYPNHDAIWRAKRDLKEMLAAAVLDGSIERSRGMEEYLRSLGKATPDRCNYCWNESHNGQRMDKTCSKCGKGRYVQPALKRIELTDSWTPERPVMWKPTNIIPKYEKVPVRQTWLTGGIVQGAEDKPNGLCQCGRWTTKRNDEGWFCYECEFRAIHA